MVASVLGELMPDMLVKLYNLPDHRELISRLAGEGIAIRRVQPYEFSKLQNFVTEAFGQGWADEIGASISHQPITCFIAIDGKKIVGFAAYECTRRNYFGPTGVLESHRNRGIGQALLLACLHSMYEMGYAYAIIGGAGPADYYAKCAGAEPIPDSSPGIYTEAVD